MEATTIAAEIHLSSLRKDLESLKVDIQRQNNLLNRGPSSFPEEEALKSASLTHGGAGTLAYLKQVSDNSSAVNDIRTILKSKNRTHVNIETRHLKKTTLIATVFYSEDASKFVRINILASSQIKDILDSLSRMWNISTENFELVACVSQRDGVWEPLTIKENFVVQLLQLKSDASRGYGCNGHTGSVFHNGANLLPPLYMVKKQGTANSSVDALFDGLEADEFVTFCNFVVFAQRYMETRPVDLLRTYMIFYFKGCEFESDLVETPTGDLGATKEHVKEMAKVLHSMPSHGAVEFMDEKARTKVLTAQSMVLRVFFWIVSFGDRENVDLKSRRISRGLLCKALSRCGPSDGYTALWNRVIGSDISEIDWSMFLLHWLSFIAEDDQLHEKVLNEVQQFEYRREHIHRRKRKTDTYSVLEIVKFVAMLVVFMVALSAGLLSLVIDQSYNPDERFGSAILSPINAYNEYACDLSNKGSRFYDGGFGFTSDCFSVIIRHGLFNFFYQGAVTCPLDINATASIAYPVFSNCSLNELNDFTGTVFSYNYFQPQYVLIRQLKVSGTTCPSTDMLFSNSYFKSNAECYGDYSEDTRDEAPIPGFENVSFGQFQTFAGLETVTGTFGTYDNTGYGFNFGEVTSDVLSSATEWQTVAEQMFGYTGWLSYSTRAIIVNAGIYSPNTGRITSLEIIYELSPALTVSVNVVIRNSYLHSNLSGLYWLLLAVALLVLVLDAVVAFQLKIALRKRVGACRFAFVTFLKSPYSLSLLFLVAFTIVVLVFSYQFENSIPDMAALAGPGVPMWNGVSMYNRYNHLLRSEAVLVVVSLAPMAIWMRLTTKFRFVSKGVRHSLRQIGVLAIIQLWMVVIVAFGTQYTSWNFKFSQAFYKIMGAVFGGGITGFPSFENVLQHPVGTVHSFPNSFMSVIQTFLAIVVLLILGMMFPAVIVMLVLHRMEVEEFNDGVSGRSAERSAKKTFMKIFQSCSKSTKQNKNDEIQVGVDNENRNSVEEESEIEMVPQPRNPII